MVQIANNTTMVKQINIELVKTALRASTYGTKSTIASSTGLSVATCGNILNELLERGEVIETDLEQPNGGRPARRFMFNANYSYIICMHISNEGGIHKITYAVTNLVGQIIERSSVNLKTINYEVIDKLIEKLIDKYENMKAIGIGIPGVIYGGIVGAGDIEELRDLPLADRLKDKYNLEIIIENDMKLIAYGFYKRQNYDEDKTIAVVNFPKDNCSGSGIIINGHIIKGCTNFAGEISFLPFDSSREEQIEQLDAENRFLSLAVKTITSIIAIINPETIVVTGELVHQDIMDELCNRCRKRIPEEHMPQILLQENMQDDYINGLVSITLKI